MAKKKEAPLENVRIIGIFAHVDAGKTTTSESILYYTGRIHRAGNIDDGDTQMDFLQQERERGITIMSAATACHWRGNRINLIDTPGHIDFTAEVVRSIRVIDGAVMILCAVGGVEPQTEAVWLHANRERLPRLIFINKLDRIGADFYSVVDEVHERLTPSALPLELPIYNEDDFIGVVDLLTQQSLIWRNGADDPAIGPVPLEMQSEVAEARDVLVDAICETDDDLLEQRLEGVELDVDVLRAGAAQGVDCGRPSCPCSAGRRAIVSACSRCWMPSSITCPRRWICRRFWATIPGMMERGHRAGGRLRRALLRVGVQDRHRPARRASDVGARLLRPDGCRRHRLQPADGRARARGAHLPDARQTAASRRTVWPPATWWRWSA